MLKRIKFLKWYKTLCSISLLILSLSIKLFKSSLNSSLIRLSKVVWASIKTTLASLISHLISNSSTWIFNSRLWRKTTRLHHIWCTSNNRSSLKINNFSCNKTNIKPCRNNSFTEHPRLRQTLMHFTKQMICKLQFNYKLVSTTLNCLEWILSSSTIFKMQEIKWIAIIKKVHSPQCLCLIKHNRTKKI